MRLISRNFVSVSFVVVWFDYFGRLCFAIDIIIIILCCLGGARLCLVLVKHQPASKLLESIKQAYSARHKDVRDGTLEEILMDGRVTETATAGSRVGSLHVGRV